VNRNCLLGMELQKVKYAYSLEDTLFLKIHLKVIIGQGHETMSIRKMLQDYLKQKKN
jgi:hypothetical protein